MNSFFTHCHWNLLKHIHDFIHFCLKSNNYFTTQHYFFLMNYIQAVYINASAHVMLTPHPQDLPTLKTKSKNKYKIEIRKTWICTEIGWNSTSVLDVLRFFTFFTYACFDFMNSQKIIKPRFCKNWKMLNSAKWNLENVNSHQNCWRIDLRDRFCIFYIVYFFEWTSGESYCENGCGFQQSMANRPPKNAKIKPSKKLKYLIFCEILRVWVP